MISFGIPSGTKNLSSAFSELLLKLSSKFFILVIVLFSSRIFVMFHFINFYLLLLFSICSYIILLLPCFCSFWHFIHGFFCFTSLNIFKTVNLKSLSSKYNACVSLGMVTISFFYELVKVSWKLNILNIIMCKGALEIRRFSPIQGLFLFLQL